MAFWKRRVAQSCIYGVDLNPLAVDLAKLSLWLATVAKDRPLSFLDHHLRCGNALVGTRLADLQVGSRGAGAQRKTKKAKAQPEAQLALFDEEALRQTMSRAVGSMWLIEASAAHSVADVKEQEQAYQSVRADLNAKYGRLADLVTATHFGLHVDQTLWNPLADYATGRSIAAHQRIVEWLHEAERIAQARRFFHWELEFPEVFFDRHGQPLGDAAGFDAVVGNPPYIRSVRLKEFDSQSWLFYSQQYTVAANKEYDIYLCFVEASLKMLNTSSHFGMIIPNKWFTTQVGEALRVLLSSRQAVEAIVDFGAFQVFENVTTYTCLLFLNGISQDQAAIATLQIAQDKSQPLPGEHGSWIIDKVSHTDLTNMAWSFVFGSTDQLLKRLRALPQLQNVASVFKGTGTSADQVFFMQSNGTAFYSRSLEQWVEIEQELIKPTLTGRDINPYHYTTDNYLLFPYKFVDGQVQLITPDEMRIQFPKAWAYLNTSQNRTALEGRDKGEFQHRSDWYGYGRPQNMHLLGLPKIVLPDVAGQAEFTYDDEGRYIIDTVYAIRLKEGVNISLLALTTLLNSSLMTFFLQQTGTDLRGGYFRMKTAYLNPFPIPRIAFSTPAAERERLVDAGRVRYAHGDYAAVLAMVGDALPRLTDGVPDAASERSDVVHDLLAFLAEQMIALNTQRHDALEDLLLDLEGVLPPGTRDKLSRLWTPPRAGATADPEAARVLGSLAARRISTRSSTGCTPSLTTRSRSWKATRAMPPTQPTDIRVMLSASRCCSMRLFTEPVLSAVLSPSKGAAEGFRVTWRARRAGVTRFTMKPIGMLSAAKHLVDAAMTRVRVRHVIHTACSRAASGSTQMCGCTPPERPQHYIHRVTRVCNSNKS